MPHHPDPADDVAHEPCDALRRTCREMRERCRAAHERTEAFTRRAHGAASRWRSGDRRAEVAGTAAPVADGGRSAGSSLRPGV